MDIANIIDAIQANRVNVTQHARGEAREDGLLLDEFSTPLKMVKSLKIIQQMPLIQVV